MIASANQFGFYQRLRESIEQSEKRLKRWRQLRYELIKVYAGKKFVDLPDMEHDPVNLMYQTANIYMMSMSANRPRILTSTEDPALIGFRQTFQTNVNNMLVQLRAQQVFQACVLDAFFGMGIIKTTLGDHGSVEVHTNQFIDVGRPYMERVGFDNFIFDTSCNAWSKIRYACDTYQVPLSHVQDPERYYQKVVERIQPSKVPERDEQGESRVSEFSTSDYPDSVELTPMVTLMDVWLPEQQEVWVCAKDHPELPPISRIEWYGRESGPYQILRFGRVPDMILPASPAQQLEKLHHMTNSLLRKGEFEAQNHKEVGIYTPAAAKDADRIKHANHGDFVQVKNVNDLGQLSFTGVDGPTQALAIAGLDLFDRMAGNLQAMGGLGPQADTATQDQLIHDRVGKHEAYLLSRVLDFMTDVVIDMADLMWSDEALEMEGTRTLEGTDWPLPDNWAPDMRLGRFDQYKFTIDPYSLPYRSPSQRLGALNNALGLYMEMQAAGVLGQHGARIDVQRMVEIQAELLGEPRLKEIVKFDMPPQEVPATTDGSKMPRESTRNYVRHNVPTGGTEQSRRATLQQSLMGGGNANGDQMAALTR